MAKYPDPTYSHRDATATGPGRIIDIGTADEKGYPPVMIVNLVGGSQEIVIEGDSTWLTTEQATTVDGIVDVTPPDGEHPPPPEPPYTPGPCSQALPTAGSGDSWDVQTFSTPGAFTWNKPANAKAGAGNTVIDLLAGGGAGQSAQGSTCTISAGGGGGGGGGQRAGGAFDPADLPSSVAGVVGAGGTPGTGGGNSGTVPPTFGTDGEDTTFGSVSDDWYLIALAGKAGGFGACESGSGAEGGGGTAENTGSTGVNGGGGGSTASGFSGSNPSGGGSVCGGPGGGGGGYILKDTAPHTAYGGRGGLPGTSSVGTGALGGAPERIVGGHVGGNGVSGTDGDIDTPGTAGGGGGATDGTDPSYVGGAGGNGGFPAAGGGGGGGSGRSEGIGGNSGAGGGGVIRITTLCH